MKSKRTPLLIKKAMLTPSSLRKTKYHFIKDQQQDIGVLTLKNVLVAFVYQSGYIHSIMETENSRSINESSFFISRYFYEFQMSLKNRRTKFHAETCVHHVLAISSILLLKPGRTNPEIVDLFGINNINAVIEDVKERLEVKEEDLDMNIITSITKIIENVKKKSMTRSEAVATMLKMEKESKGNGFKVIKSIANIIAKVPNTPVMETIKENELCTRYLDPLLCGLFDDPDSNTFFRWTNERPSEVKGSDNELSSERPDAVISCLEGVKWINNQGFGEAKCSSESNNNYLTSMDLIRLGVFSKMSIDAHSNNGVLSVQAIGTSLTFYITIHTHDNLYIMHEIAEILAPRCLDDVLKYLMDFNKLLYIVDLFEKWCLHQASPSQQHTSSVNLTTLCGSVSSSNSRGRECVTKHFYR